MIRWVNEVTEFDRARGVYALIMWGFGMVGVQFALIVAAGENPVTPDLYGPSVYAVPALFWSLTQASTCFVSAAGCAFGGRSGAAFALLGAAPAMLLFVLLWVLAMDASQGTLVVAGNRSITAPLTSLICVSAFRRALL